MRLNYKILFITDSLGYPRPEPEFVLYQETYISLLKNEFADCDFIHQGRGGATILDLYKHSAYYHQTLRPDLVFMQSGIVDCAPRALSVIEQQIMSRLPLVGGLCMTLVKKYSRALRKARNMTYTSLEAFKNGVEQFESLFANVYWIGILPVAREYDDKVEGIGRNVNLYNKILRQRRYVETTDFDRSMIMSDYHHLSRAGHRKMYEQIAKIIRAELAVSKSNAAGRAEN
jgi:hypothetical protein